MPSAGRGISRNPGLSVFRGSVLEDIRPAFALRRFARVHSGVVAAVQSDRKDAGKPEEIGVGR